MEQKPVVRFVDEELTRSFAVVKRFGIIRGGRRKDDERVLVASVTGTTAVVFAVTGIERVATDERFAALIVFRIRHGEEVRGINRQEQLEVNLACGKFVGELSEEPLELTAGRIVGDVQRIAQGFENSAVFFTRNIGIRSELLNGVDSVVVFVVRTRKERNSAVDEETRFGRGVQSGGSKNNVCEIVNEDVIGIVSFGTVDDDGLKIFVPALGFAEQVAKFAFALDGVVGKAIDEIAGNVVEHV